MPPNDLSVPVDAIKKTGSLKGYFSLRAIIKKPAGLMIGFFLGSVIRYRRREVVETLRRCFPEKNTREIASIADGMYRNFGLNIAEWLSMPWIRDVGQFVSENIEIENLGYFMDTLARGRGVIVLAAHVGNFMFLPVASISVDVPLHVITKEIRPAWLHRKWDAVFSRFGAQLLARRNSYKECRKILKNNGTLGFMLDQNMKRKRGVFVDFFGTPACTSHGLALLSADCMAPVVPVFTFRKQDGTHKVVVQQPIEPPSDKKPGTIRQATQGYTAIIEKMVREHPEQWIWIHRRWRTKPENENT